jgi:hypothetical protein
VTCFPSFVQLPRSHTALAQSPLSYHTLIHSSRLQLDAINCTKLGPTRHMCVHASRLNPITFTNSGGATKNTNSKSAPHQQDNPIFQNDEHLHPFMPELNDLNFQASNLLIEKLFTISAFMQLKRCHTTPCKSPQSQHTMMRSG